MRPMLLPKSLEFGPRVLPTWVPEESWRHRVLPFAFAKRLRAFFFCLFFCGATLVVASLFTRVRSGAGGGADGGDGNCEAGAKIVGTHGGSAKTEVYIKRSPEYYRRCFR